MAYGYWTAEHRVLRLFGLLAGIAAGLLMILAMSLFAVIVGVIALLAAVAIFDGSTGGAVVMLAIGILTLVFSGGIGGMVSLLAILSGVLGLAGS